MLNINIDQHVIPSLRSAAAAVQRGDTKHAKDFLDRFASLLIRCARQNRQATGDLLEYAENVTGLNFTAVCDGANA